jgi:hypothetical protein
MFNKSRSGERAFPMRDLYPAYGLRLPQIAMVGYSKPHRHEVATDIGTDNAADVGFPAVYVFDRLSRDLHESTR